MTTKTSYLGKYREIIFAVAFFLVFDLAVLVLNFYISFQISEDALSINLAGRQRMLSQRMTKALLSVETDTAHALDVTASMAELGTAVKLFDTTLNSFKSGGTVTGGDGKQVALKVVETASGKEILKKADLIWEPYKIVLAPVLAGGFVAPEQLDAVVKYARSNNLKLLGLMNDLTNDLEKTANKKADNLRQVQTGGIVLALLNFAFILFKFIRRLRDSDSKIEAAQKETAEILSTVKEGLFLLDPHYKIGTQFSASLPEMLGHAITPGTNFLKILEDIVPDTTYITSKDFIELLFGNRVKEALIGQLNPLSHVEVNIPVPGGGTSRRFLALHFNRVRSEGKISHLLVTVLDITESVELENALAEAQKKASSGIDVILDMLKIEPAVLSRFIDTSEARLLEVNGLLRDINPATSRRNIAAIFRIVHTIKGDAATYELHMFEELAHQFEEQLIPLREKGDVSGDELLALPLPLEDFLQRLSLVRGMVGKLSHYFEGDLRHDTSEHTFAESLAKLGERIATDQGKTVSVITEMEALADLPQHARDQLMDIAIQLLRNAVSHGIEPMEVREYLSKPAAGNVYIGLKKDESGGYELLIRDDGRGISRLRIEQALLRSGRYTQEQLDEMDQRLLIMQIFESGFSTAEPGGKDAGRGVGMDVVRQKVQQLGAHLRLASRENLFTQFSISFAV